MPDGRGMLWESLKYTCLYVIHSWGGLIKWFLGIHSSLLRQIFSVLVTVIESNRTYRIYIIYNTYDISHITYIVPYIVLFIYTYVIYMYIYNIYGIYWHALQVVVQWVQQWMSANGRAKNLVAVRSMRLDVSAVLQHTAESQRSRPWCQRRNRLTSKSESKQIKREQASFFHVLYVDCQEKMWTRLKVDFPTLKIWIRSESSHFK